MIASGVTSLDLSIAHCSAEATEQLPGGIEPHAQ